MQRASWVLLCGAAAWCLGGDSAALGQGVKSPAGKSSTDKTQAAQVESRDLLAEVDLKVVQQKGWKLADGKLEIPKGERQRMSLAGKPPEEYQLDVTAERLAGKDALVLGIVVGSRLTTIQLEAYGGKASGLHLIGSVGCDRNETSYQKPIFTPGKLVKIKVVVRRRGVSLECDDQPIFVWQGDPLDLTLYTTWRMEDPKALFIGAHQCSYRIHAISLRPLPKEEEPAQVEVVGPLPAPDHDKPWPLPAGLNVMTDAKFRALSLEIHLRRAADYRELTADPQAVREDAAAFLAEAEKAYWEIAPKKSWEGLRVRGEQLVSRGSTDPLVHSALASACIATKKTEEEKKHRSAADAGFAKSKYRAAWQLRNALRGIDLAYMTPGDKPAVQKTVRLTATAAGDVSLGRAGQTFLMDHVRDFFQRTTMPDQTALYDALKVQENVDPWTLNVVAGMYYKKLAWHYRGSGWASEVTPEGMKGFRESLNSAAWYLTQAWQQRPDAPEAAAEMIVVSLANGGPGSPRQWFDVAVAAQLDYAPAYDGMVMALSPNWGGSFDQLMAFGLECSGTKRYDTIVPHALLIIIDKLQRDLGAKSNELWRTPAVYQAAHAVLEGMAAEPTKVDERDWLLSRCVEVAVKADQLADARDALDQVGDKVDRELLNRAGRRVDFTISRIYAMTGPHYAALKGAEDLIFPLSLREKPQHRERALAAYDAVLKSNEDPRAKPYLEANREMIAREIEYQSGQWVDMNFKHELTWRKNGDWKVEDERTVVGTYKSGVMLMLSTSVFLPPYEMTVELEPIELRQMCSVGFMAGASQREPLCMVLWVDPKRNELGGTVFNDLPKPWRVAAKKTNFLHARVWPQHWEMYMNGDGGQGQMPEPIDCDGFVGLSSLYWFNQPGGTVRFRNFRVRKLTSPPTPEFNDAKERVDHFTKLLDDFPDNHRGRYLRGIARYYTEDFAEGLKDLEQVYKVIPETTGLRLWLGATLIKRNEPRRGLEMLEQSYKQNPRVSLTAMYLAEVYATSFDDSIRNGAKAVQMAELGMRLADKPSVFNLAILSNAYAEAGQFDKALSTARQALEMTTNEKAIELLKKRIALFERKEPYHVDPPEK